MSLFLVTGAAGFIGAAVARQLLGDGHRVVAIDNLSTGFRRNVPPGTEFFEAACQDAAVYQAIPRESYEAIFHIAGQSSGEISFDDPVYDLQTNTQSTLLLLQFARQVGCRKMLYASSMSVYGDQPDAPVAEDASPVPKSFYGVGKLASEHYLRLYTQFGIHSSALRLFNVYGPGQNMENMRQGMVSIYLSQALQSRHIHVKGSADRYRDFVYIDDVVDAFVKGAAREPRGELAEPLVLNIGTGVRTTVATLLSEIRASLPFEITTKFEGSTSGDQFGIYADRSQAAQIGWSPGTPLHDGVRQMAQWALESINPTR